MVSFKTGYLTTVTIAFLLLTVTAGGIVGCGNGSPSGADSGNVSEDVESVDLIVIDAAELPIGDYFPPLDDKRIEIASPLDWKWFGRNSDFVARFYKSSDSSLPWIFVKASDSPYGLDDVNDENYMQLFDAVDKETAEVKSLLETPLPMNLGGNYWIRYVLKAKLRDEGAERQILVTVLGGRKYEIDLQIRARSIHDHKASSYAVAASLRPAKLPDDDPPAKAAADKAAPDKAAPDKAAPDKAAADKAAPDKAAADKAAPDKAAVKK